MLQVKGSRILRCPACETRFTANGEDLEPVLPTLPSEATPGRRTCVPLDQGKLSLSDPLLCKTCQHHQNILLQLLSSCEYPPSLGTVSGRGTEEMGGEEEEKEKEEEEEERKFLQRYREDLERRYPLCTTCRTRVQERLRIVEYKVRSRRLALRSRSEQVLDVQRERSAAHVRRIVFLGDLAVQLVFTTVFLWHWTRQVEEDELLEETRGVDGLGGLFGRNVTWNLLIIPMAMTTIATDWCNVLRMGWTLILLFLRMALTKLLVTVDLSTGPFVLLSFACFVLLWQIHQSSLGKKRRDFSASIRSTGSRPSGLRNTVSSPFGGSAEEIPLRSVEPTRSRDSLTAKLASWDTTIVEKLDAKSPLSTRFTDLSNPESPRSSPFSVPKSALACARKTLQSPLTPLRPSMLDASRCSGLEGELEGFSLAETPKRSRQAQPQTSLSSDQLFGASFFVMARCLAGNQSECLAGVLLLAVLFRGVVWNRLPASLRFVINVLVLARLGWLLLCRLGPELVPSRVLEVISDRIFCVVDGIILLSR